MAQAFFGGVHPNDMKAATNEKAIEQLAPPAEVVIPMSMHFGAPCTPLVKAGDLVKVGQKIGEFRGLGAPIHASVSGKVKAVEPRPYSIKDNAVKGLHSICQHIWKTQQWPQDLKMSVFIPVPKKGNAKEMLKLPHNCAYLTR